MKIVVLVVTLIIAPYTLLAGEADEFVNWDSEPSSSLKTNETLTVYPEKKTVVNPDIDRDKTPKYSNANTDKAAEVLIRGKRIQWYCGGRIWYIKWTPSWNNASASSPLYQIYLGANHNDYSILALIGLAKEGWDQEELAVHEYTRSYTYYSWYSGYRTYYRTFTDSEDLNRTYDRLDIDLSLMKRINENGLSLGIGVRATEMEENSRDYYNYTLPYHKILYFGPQLIGGYACPISPWPAWLVSASSVIGYYKTTYKTAQIENGDMFDSHSESGYGIGYAFDASIIYNHGNMLFRGGYKYQAFQNDVVDESDVQKDVFMGPYMELSISF